MKMRAEVGSIGVLSVVNLTAVTFLSNIGTFLLYGLTNLVAFVAFRRAPQARTIKHVLVPVLGVIANIGMLLAVIYLGILGGGDTRTAALISIIAAMAWLVAGGIFFVSNTRARSREVWTVRTSETAST